jgi:hypothetical protein
MERSTGDGARSEGNVQISFTKEFNATLMHFSFKATGN